MASTPKASGRLIAVSNRTAYGDENRAGGLAVALWDALESSRGLWVGWSGEIVPNPSSLFQRDDYDGVSFALCDYGEAEFEGFYLGYSNSVLWPVMHARLDLAQFDGQDFPAYCAVNQRIADGLLAHTEPGDMIWVHDYHFLLVARQLKESGWNSPCGFFLHTPFPPAGSFRAIPDHRELGEGLLAYDVIGLQSRSDVANLAMYFEVEFGATRIDERRVSVNGREITILHCPIGIDADGFAQVATSQAAFDAGEKISVFLRDRDLIIGVDRMDYSKGLPQRFEGMARFFDKNPELHGRVSFTQIAPPSRSLVDEYIQLREKLDALAGRINGNYGDLDWIPIRYLARGYAREEIAGLYRLSCACLVTPLQDGMNLVAKEFIAAQDPEDPGVLILSQFAGAAEQMTEALIVNPHDPDAIANAVREAIDMSLDERKRRWRALFDGICRENINWWRDRFLAALQEVSV